MTPFSGNRSDLDLGADIGVESVNSIFLYKDLGQSFGDLEIKMGNSITTMVWRTDEGDASSTFICRHDTNTGDRKITVNGETKVEERVRTVTLQTIADG